MSWLFSQALVEAFSEESSLDGAPSVQSSGNHTQLAYLPPDRMTAFSRLSRFGMTFKPVTEDRGEELLMSYRAAFPARTSQSQEKEMDWTESEAECGNTWRGWLAKLDPDSSLWRTAQCSLLEEEPESLQTLPRSGMTRGGLLWELPMSERRTKESDFGWWPTPTASDCKGGKASGIQYRSQRFIRTSSTSGTEFGARLADAFRLMNGNQLQPNFSEWMMGWPLGWTGLKPLETDKSHSAPQQLGESLPLSSLG